MSIVASIFLAATTVYRLELTDEVPYIVGADGERRQVVIVEPEQYAMLTGRLDQVWRSMNADENGRTKLHGMRVDQTVDEKTMEKHTIYKDGYIFTEKMQPKRTVTIQRKAKKVSSDDRRKRVSARHWELMKKREDAQKQPVKEVTVEHDALTGKDIVK